MSPLAQEVIDALVEQQLLAGCRVCQATGVAPVQDEDTENHVLVHMVAFPKGTCPLSDNVLPGDFANPIRRQIASVAMDKRGDEDAVMAAWVSEVGPRSAKHWGAFLNDIYTRYGIYEDPAHRAQLFARFFGLAKRRDLAAQAKDFLGLLTVQAASNQELLDRLRNMANTLKATR